MKNLFFLLIASLLLTTISCGKDDCEAGQLSTNIVGEWSVTALGFPAGDVKFNANGTLEDVDDALIDGEIGGVAVDEKTYVVTSNDAFTLRATQGANFVEQDVDVISYTCDEIIAEILGFQFTMRRK